QENGIFHFDPESDAPIFSIDTPPPTVSGHLHLGHIYSYSHTDFMARFFRMRGFNVYYPMGYDDNGLPTERLVQRQEGITAQEVGRQAFIEACLRVSETAEKEYEALWQRTGLSIDWRYTYRTIDERSRRISQGSFLDLHKQGRAYQQKAPAIWCPECQTAIAQAEVDDLTRESEYVTLAFTLEDGSTLPIATTRPELLAACVAIFVHPEDGRFSHLIDKTAPQTATTPLFNQTVPILADPGADPEKGTGAVMCCTFGDTADVAWWRTHDLPLIELLGKNGRLLSPAADFANLTIADARAAIKNALADAGRLLSRQPTEQTIGVHERCDTPVEYIVVNQWFIRVLDFKEELLEAGEQITWHPAHMKMRYRQWVENLNWDWGISRQRYFGVPIPVWYCDDCGETILPDESQLPIDPLATQPDSPCSHCGSSNFTPESDVMDTWATSSMSPQIAGAKELPYSLRPQAHEIIRTWTFYTLVKSLYHYKKLPWTTIALSGWGLAPEGTQKISKSRGGGPIAPMEMIERYSADAVRYWTSSTGLGKDSRISEEKIQAGAKLVTKIWNVARFSSRFLTEESPSDSESCQSNSLADRWILARLQRLIERTTQLFENYDYATAKSEIEQFFWRDLADNYLEMAKLRLYKTEASDAHNTLWHTLLNTLKLFAPFLPYVTEMIYRGIFATSDTDSIHRSRWPKGNAAWQDEAVEKAGELLVGIGTAVRRYKSEKSLGLGSELTSLQIYTPNLELANLLAQGTKDLQSISRAKEIAFVDSAPETAVQLGEIQLIITE
ncbi:MAG: valine--tRNA ligase, partial [Chloroflexota bacterium]